MIKDTENIKITIVITVYNLDIFIAECLDSIVSQTYKNIQIIVIDDGSTDNSGDICDSYEKADERITVIHQKNHGLVHARKEGIKRAQGKYVLFIDGDDWIDVDLCEILIDKSNGGNTDIVICNYIKEYGERVDKVRNVIGEGYYDFERIKTDIYPCMIYTGKFYEKGLETFICGKLVKLEILRNVLDDIDNNISFGEGGMWLYSCMAYTRSVYIAGVFPYHYRMRNSSMTINSSKTNLNTLYANLLLMTKKYNDFQKMICGQLKYMMLFLIIWADLGSINKYEDKLEPFGKAKKNSRIVIYGAWRFGRQLYKYIQERKFFDIVLWIDKNAYEYQKAGMDVVLPESILNVDYDYVLIASEVYRVRKSMEMELLNLGVAASKILSIDEKVVSEMDLPKEYHMTRKQVLADV